MGAKSAIDELRGRIKELLGHLTGDRQKSHRGRADTERAKARGLAEAAAATGSPPDRDDPRTSGDPLA